MMMVTMRQQVQSKYGWDQRHPRFAWGGGGSDCHQWPMLFLKKYQSNQDDDDHYDCDDDDDDIDYCKTIMLNFFATEVDHGKGRANR